MVAVASLSRAELVLMDIAVDIDVVVFVVGSA
jgi:hypothetical protein